MADLGAFFGNPNIQRQGARARALAGQRDVNTLPDPLTYAVMQGLLGTRPDEMGFSVLNPDYEKIKKVAEPAFALGLLGQAAPVLAPLTKGLPVGASIKNVGEDLLSYRGTHTAPNAKRYGATLDDLTKILPDDVYSQEGKRLYGIGDRLIDSEWRIAALKTRGKPEAEIEIFRAVPKGVKEINDGDWVSTSKAYAKTHGEGTLNGEYDIISKKVKAKTLSTEGYPYEYGYNEIPTTTAPTLETGLLGSKVPSPSSLTMPDVPTVEQMQKFGRVETVPLSQAVSFQSARNWDKFNKGEHVGDLVQGFGDKPLALRLENGEYIIYDGNHRTDLAIQAGKTEIPMNVIDVKSYDPSNAGRRPVPPSMTDDELLRSLLD
jgi:hypothetical protein